MEVHTPKGPIHGWRAFFGEVGIIVVGVLIALGAEQTVEALHESAQRHDLRQALDRDGQQAVSDSRKSIAFADSVAAGQIALIDQVRSARAAHRPLGVETRFHHPEYDVPTNPAFQAARSSGRLSLLTPQEVAAYSEADVMAEAAKTTFGNFRMANSALRTFRFKFRKTNGSVDLSQASPSEVERYYDLLADVLGAVANFKSAVSANLGLQESLLKGERRLPSLYRAERAHDGSLDALRLK